MKSIKKIATVTILVFIIVSCSNEPSLQKYYVNKSESPNFISLTIPANVIKITDAELTDEQQQAYESVEKLNVLAFKLKGADKATFNEEKSQITQILKNKKYQELMRINNGKQTGVVKYIGNDDTIDEVIVFGSDDVNGFALVRVLGKNMKPENMMQLVQAVNTGNINGEGLNELKQFFGK